MYRFFKFDDVGILVADTQGDEQVEAVISTEQAPDLEATAAIDAGARETHSENGPLSTASEVASASGSLVQPLALQPKPIESGAKLLKKLFGTKRKIVFWIAGFVALILMIVGGVALSSYFEEKAEERANAVEHFEDMEAAYKGERSSLTAAVTSAKKLLESTPQESVMGQEVLAHLETTVESASDALAAKQPQGSDSIEGWSTEEILDGASVLKAATAPLEEESQALALAFDTVEASIEAKRAADAEAAKKAKIDAAGPISYEELARGGASLLGNYYRFEGEVIQDAGSGTYRVSVTRDPGYSRDFWKDPILVSITGDTSQRILEDDIISFVGASLGMQTYESIFGQEISVPSVLVEGQYVTVSGRTS